MLRLSLSSSVFAISLFALAAERPVSDPPGPRLWLVQSGSARVYIFGFGEAKDTSWLTPSIRRAFDESAELWIETAGPGASADQSAADRAAAAERMRKLGEESGRTLFDVLAPPVRTRTLEYVAKLGIDRDSIARLRPWRAYYSINAAFWSKRAPGYPQVDPDAVLAEMARKAGKKIGHEFPTRESFVTFMATMPDQAQSQYIEWLLDFLDDYEKGFNDTTASFSWITGNPGDTPIRSLERMRTRMPELYQVMQPQHNIWWARRIYELLASGGTSFVAVGQLHVLGPDGIHRQLERLGIHVKPVP